MRILDIRVDGFGVWNTMSVDELSEGITLFYGPNEAGKTTLMQFLRAILYGFSRERRKLYLPPVFGGEAGGMLRVRNHSGEFVVERREYDKDVDGQGRVIVLAANGSRQGQHLLNVLISGIDESIFNNVFAVGIRELQELATLNDTQAAEQLYNLASGIDRVSLVEVMRHLEGSRRAIWDPEQQDNELNGLVTRRGKLTAEIHELQRQTRRWSDLATQRRTLLGEVDELEQRSTQLTHELRAVEIASQVRDPWYARTEVLRELERIGNIEALPRDAMQRLETLNAEREQLRESLQPLRKQEQGLRREMASQPINQALWNQSSRIEAVCEHGPWIAALDDEIHRLSASVEECEVELLRHEDGLAASSGPAVDSGTLVTPKIVQQLQPAAHSLREAARKRAIARKVQKKSRQDVDETAAELEEELRGRNFEDFDEALEQTSLLVKRLRRRVQLEQKLEAMQRQRHELEDEHGELLDHQFQRVRILAGIGGMFVFGFVMSLTGIFGWNLMPMSLEVGWGVALLGLICIGLSVAWKIVLERTASEELRDSLSRQDAIQNEMEVIADERDALDRELPPGRGGFAARLVSAEKELHDLEEMAPLHEQRQRAEKKKSETGRHNSGADEELREARSRWRRALRQTGLPETLTAKHVRQLAAHHQRKSTLEKRLAEQKERLQKQVADRDLLVDRLEQLNRDVGMNVVSPDPQIQLSQLATALAGQQQMVEKRRELQKEIRHIRQQLSKGLQKLRRLGRAREALFAESRVTDEQQLRERAAGIQERDELERQSQALSDQIQTVVAGYCPEDVIAAQLQAHSKDELRQKQDLLATRLKDAQSHLTQLHLRHGEINQEMKALAENRRLAAAQFELGCVEARIEQVTNNWRTLAATLHLLEDIRVSYEAERQPETLGEASLYLQRLTEGKYARIWTPLGNNELRIDDQDGKAIPLDILSRGTREAVFLSLRLALVAAYGRRGVSIPMVLDDVLVNLDARRAAAAVDLLCDFAREGRQLLFFTCHEHIKALFMEAGIDTRVLPAHGIPGVHVVPLLEQHPQPETASQPIEESEFDDEAAADHGTEDDGQAVVAADEDTQDEDTQDELHESELLESELAESELHEGELEEGEQAVGELEEEDEEEEDDDQHEASRDEPSEVVALSSDDAQEEVVDDYYELAESEPELTPEARSASEAGEYVLGDYELAAPENEASRQLVLMQYIAELEAAVELQKQADEARGEVVGPLITSAPPADDQAAEPQEDPQSAADAVVEETGMEDVDLERSDDEPFGDTAWWWESPRRSLEEEEETAA